MPRTSTHTMETEIEVRTPIAGTPDDYDADYPMVEITFTYLPGCPAYTPRGEYAPIDPPEPAEVEFVSARLIDGNGLTLTPDQVSALAHDYIHSDAGYRDALGWAEYDNR